MIDSHSKLRALASTRRDQATTTQALRIPVVMDQGAADRMAEIHAQHSQLGSAARANEAQHDKDIERLELRIADIRDELAERRDEETGDVADVRGNGVDTTGLGQRLARAEADLARLEEERAEARATEDAELERLREAFDDAKKASSESTIQLVFQRIEAHAYEALLIAHGGAELFKDTSKERPFLDALLAAAFLRIEHPDGTSEQVKWSDFVELVAPSVGELGLWRVQVFKHQAHSGVDVPFALRPFKPTRSS